MRGPDRTPFLRMAEEASSSYSGLATDVPSSPLTPTFQAGQAGQQRPRHAGRQAKSQKHASPFCMPPEDKPFPSFSANPFLPPAMDSMHPGSAATSGNGASAKSDPISTASPAFPRAPGPALNGIHAGLGAKSGNEGKAASAEAAAQLPPRFASAVNISEGSAATPAAAQYRSPTTAARSGHRTATRRRGHLRTPGGDSPFLREGSPMDWSPSVPEPAAALPADGCRRNDSKDVTRSKHVSAAGFGGRGMSSKDDELDGLHADLAASSLSGHGNMQQAQLNEKFSSSFTLGGHTDTHGGRSPAQPAAESAANTKPQDMGASSVATAPKAPAQPPSANHAAPSSRAASQPEANGTSKDESGKHNLGEALEAQFAELTARWKACPDLPSTGQPGRSRESHAAAAQAAAPTPGTGSLGGASMGGRSLSDDSSADSWLPRGVLHHGSARSPATGRRARTSSLSHAAKQMKDARHHIRVDTRPGMTLRDFKAAARAQACTKSPVSSTHKHEDARKTSSKAAVPEAANGHLNGFSHPSEAPAAAPDKGQAWRSYQSSQAGTPQECSPAEGSSTQQAASSDGTADRPQPATADLDEYLSRQRRVRPGASADASNGPEPCASAGADKAGASVRRARPSSEGSASHIPSSSAAQPSQAYLADRRDVPASSTPAGTPEGAAQAAGQEHADMSRASAAGTIPVPQTEAGTGSFTFTFGQQAVSDGGQSKHQPVFAAPGGTQEPLLPQSGVSFGAPATAGASAAGKAWPKAQRSPKRSTAQAFRPGGAAPVFMFSSPVAAPSPQHPKPSSSVPPFSFCATVAAERPTHAPTAHNSFPAWPSAGVEQPQPAFTASASQVPGSRSIPAGASPGLGGTPWAPTRLHDRFAPAAAPASRDGFGGPEQPVFTFSAPQQAASASFSGFSAQPKPAEVPQQGRAPFQKEPVFKFGQQPERQSASSGDAAAQQQPNLGSVRVRGFTFGLGSQNVPPAQNTARPFRVRLGRRHSKASVPQPPVASTQDAPAYTQPRPRMSIPVRCSNPFEGSTQGTPAASGAPAPAAEAAHGSPEQDVEKLRQRGNDAFQRGSYNRAADLYNRAIKQQAQLGVTEGLGKLYSNLAACSLQQEHFTKAIQACQLALQAEPGFHKASIRMATCHMRLGDTEAAKAALETDPGLQAHADVATKLAEIKAHGTRISAAISAADSAQSASAAEAALAQVDALLQPDQAPGSQDLRRLKHQLQLQLSRFEDAAGVCSQPRRFPSGKALPDWHWWLAVQAAFHSGELSDAIDMMSAHMAAASDRDASAQGFAIGVWKGAVDKGGQQLGTGHAQDIMSSMQRMLELKEAGNRALKASQAALAAEQYSQALQLEHPPSIPFAAVLHANRAAARQSLGQHAEAVADCLRATALKPSYAKAHSRLAVLLAGLKHNDRAVDVLERLEELVKESPREAADMARRLRDARLGAKSDAADHYKLLGVDRSATSEDVRRAYKRSALQLHPDKALAQCRFAARLGNPGLELCSRSETEQRVRDNADWLFKCIAEAHTVLTDPTARQELDSGLARQERRGGSASASAHHRARTGSYRAHATSRRPPQSPYSSYTTKTYSSCRYDGEPEGSSWEDYDNEYEPYSSNRWNYF